MERDENGRALAKYGKCGTCGRRVSALADEDFECCEPDYNSNSEEIDSYKPSKKLVTNENFSKITFSTRDMVLAMTGRGWKCFKKLRYDLESVGFDCIMTIDEETLTNIIEQLEMDEFLEVNWDGGYLKRIEKE